jgi:hypothetical protein
MSPTPNLDFASIMADLTQFQNVIGKIHAQLTNPRQKQLLGEALDNIAESRAEVEQIYPKTIAMIDDHAKNTIREAEITQQELQQKRAWLEQLKQQLAQAGQAAGGAVAVAGAIPAVAAAAAPQPPVELHPAGQLREELLARFTPKASPGSALPVKIDREIWQDWSWGDGSTQPVGD